MQKLAHLFTPFSSLIIDETYLWDHPQLHLVCQLRPHISACMLLLTFVFLSRPEVHHQRVDLKFRTAHWRQLEGLTLAVLTGF